MPRSLPPIASLRAFEAAARHMNFTRAAEELAITQAAVSYQIRLLEERLGARSLHPRTAAAPAHRNGGRTRLPCAMRSIGSAPPSKAFDKEAQTSSRCRSPRLSRPTGSCRGSAPSRWKTRRSPCGSKSSNRLTDFSREKVDAGIRSGKGQWAGIGGAPPVSARCNARRPRPRSSNGLDH